MVKQVNGTTADQLYTDAYGDGWLSVSNAPATIASSSTLMVLDSTGATVLSGTFAASADSEGFFGHHH